MVDATPVRNRVSQWLAYLDRIEGEIYYDTDYCWVTDNCGDDASSQTTGLIHEVIEDPPGAYLCLHCLRFHHLQAHSCRQEMCARPHDR